jgi:hypothetical protein
VTRLLKIFATILALVTSFFAYTSLRDPVRKVITLYELEYRGGVRLVFDVEADPSLAAVQQAERLARTGRVVATRFQRATVMKSASDS